jgi:hypothetical protein
MYAHPIRLLPLAAVVLAAACGCDADLRVSYVPTERALTVGESFTPTVRFLGCGGTEPLRDKVTWAAADTSVVRVDAANGRTTALRAGETLVMATGAKYGQLGGVRVSVRTLVAAAELALAREAVEEPLELRHVVRQALEPRRAPGRHRQDGDRDGVLVVVHAEVDDRGANDMGWSP